MIFFINFPGQVQFDPGKYRNLTGSLPKIGRRLPGDVQTHILLQSTWDNL